MKTYLPIFVALTLLALGACEEIVEVEKIVIQRDTVKVKEYVDRVFLRVDTVSEPVNVPVPTLAQGDPTVIYRDSIIYVDRVDSVFVERIVYVTNTIVETDTVVVRQYSYGEVLVIYGGRTTYQVPAEIQPLLTEFYIQAREHGFAPPGGLMTIEVQDFDAVLQAYSHHAYGPTIILNGNLTNDERWLPLFRELARQQLGKEYSQNPDDYMYPFKNANSIRVSSPRSEKDKFWNEIK
jgi:hypothetical protein